jgi:hypothetical protein
MTTTTYIRDTAYSFLQVSINAEGKEFARKHEKGTTSYGNVCSLFHTANVAIEIGNKITK